MNSNLTFTIFDSVYQKSKSFKTFIFNKQFFNTRKIGLIVLIALVYILPCKVLSQNLSQANASISLQGNTGVQFTPGLGPLAIGAPDGNWQVSTNLGGWQPGLVIAVPYQNPATCSQWSGNQGNYPWNKWITYPTLTCGGIPGSYQGCMGGLTDMWFKNQFFLPSNTLLHLNWSIWASDWVQDIAVNGTTTFDATSLPPYPNHRQKGVNFSWCRWNMGGLNTIVVHVKVRPGMFPACQVAGMKVESWGVTNYFAISGNTLACAGSTNTYIAPTPGALGLSASTYSWTKPNTWTGSSNTYSMSMNTGSISGLVTAGVYSTSGTNTMCLAVGATSVTVSPPITVAAASTTICLLKSAVLSASGAVTYTWLAPGNVVVSSVSTATVFPTSNTTYTVKGTSPVGCVFSKTVSVVVLPVSFVAITSPTAPVCSGNPVTLNAYGTSTAYIWYASPTNSTTVNPFSATPSITTTYSVSGINYNGCVNTRTVSITVIPSPTMAVSCNPSVVCSGFSSTLTATSSGTSGATSFSWSPITSTSNTVVVTPGGNTTYTATGTGTNGCVSKRTVQVLVLAPPSVTINPPFICPGIFTNTITASGALNYTWYIGSPATSTITNTSVIVVTPSITASYSVCGNGANGCTACTSVSLAPGPLIPLTTSNLTLCTNANSCTNIAVTTTLVAAVNYTWQPGGLSGATVPVCPTVNTTYTVSASSASACPSSITVAVTIKANCCSQPTAGLTQLTSLTGTLANTAFLLDNSITVSGMTQLQDCEVWITPGVSITVPPGSVLDLDHTHLFACGINMWNGIDVQDGGRITTNPGNTRQRNSMIEDAIIAINLDNISLTNSGAGTPPIDIQRIIFNRNYIGIKISNSDPGLSFFPLGITGCVFSSRNMTCTTWPTPVAPNSWASSDIAPCCPWGNNPGVKVVGPLTPTTGLAPPYPMNGFAQANLKQPYTAQPGHIGIKIESIGDASSTSMGIGVDIGRTYPDYFKDEFNLFDGLGNGIDVTDASLSTLGNVFQNMRVYSYSLSPTGLFGGNGINALANNNTNSSIQLSGMTNTSDGNRFWDCVTGVHLQNIFACEVRYALFRSTHSVNTVWWTNMPGDYGILSETNRFAFAFEQNEFNNLKYGIVCNTPVTPGSYDIFGNSSSAGIYADNLNIDQNYFGPEVASNIAYSGGAPNTSEYMGEAIQLNTPNTNGWTNWSQTSTINSNRIDRAFRGISINSMEDEPLAVAGNSIYIEDDNTFGSPATGYGIASYNSVGNLSISGNTLDAIASSANAVSLVYCNNSYGPYINCNYVSNSNYGFEFVGSNLSTVWEGNTMCTNFAGLALTSNGQIGTQGSPTAPCDNYWSPPSGSCLTWGSPFAPYQTYCDNSNPTLSQLYVCSTAAGYAPTVNGFFPGGNPYYSNGTSLMTTSVNNPTLNCSTTYPAVPNWRVAHQDTATKIKENFFDEASVKVYPNPTNGLLTIQYPNQEGTLNVMIKDMNGKTVFSDPTVTNAENSMDVSALVPSVYIIEIKNKSGKVIRYKLIKTN